MVKSKLAGGFLRQARRDLLAGKKMMKHGYLEWAFTLTHHSAELCIKAVLVGLGWIPNSLSRKELGHDLGRLTEHLPDESREWFKEFEPVLKMMILTYRDQPRYPKETATGYEMGHKKIDQKDLEKCINGTEALRKKTAKILPKISSQLKTAFT